MRVANFTITVENQYGDFMEFPYEHYFEGDDFDPDNDDMGVYEDICDDVMQHIYVTATFDGVDVEDY